VQEPVAKGLEANRCLYLTLTGLGQNLALTASAVDKYAPHQTGVFNVDVQRWLGPKSGNVAQQWYYTENH